MDEKKENTFSKVLKVVGGISGIVDKISGVIKNEMESVKRRMIEMGIVFGLLFISSLIILIGFGQFLTHKLTLEPGIAAVILGGTILVLTLLYLVIKKQ
jgi:hypothetical protein